jgi:hypothetical protein
MLAGSRIRYSVPVGMLPTLDTMLHFGNVPRAPPASVGLFRRKNPLAYPVP